MKKSTMLFAFLASALTVAAMPFMPLDKKELHPEMRPELKASEITAVEFPAVMKAPSRADAEIDELYYTLAGAPYNALAFQGQTTGTQVAMAMQIDPSFLENLTDAKITSISFYTGINAQTQTNTVKKATVFITDDLTSDNYLYTQVVEDLTTEPFSKVDVALETPFEIPAGKEIYVGAYCSVLDANCNAIVIDYMVHTNDYGGWVALRANSSAKWSWRNIAENYGFVNVGANISAPNLPKNSVSIDEIAGQPVANANTPFSFLFMLTNQGVNNVKSVTVEFGIEGEETYTDNLAVNGDWAFNESVIASAQLVGVNPSKLAEVKLTVKAVDGEPNTNANDSKSYEMAILPENSKLPRNVVIEEFTSIHCQFCPVGYTSMEMIRENYPDGNVIPVCVHVDFGSKDPMTATSFNNVYQNYGYAQGLPSSVINRSYESYPQYDELVEVVEEYLQLPALASVTANATFDADTRMLTVNTSTSFAFDYTDADKNFILSFAVTEDNVGPYSQKNGYSGYSSNVLGGWQNEPSSVSLIFNDVARQLNTYSGIKGSIPAEIIAGQTYEYTHQFKALQTVKDIEKAHVIVYLLNTKTGEIENACTIPMNSEAGIDSVIVDSETLDSNAPAEYFNLQGIRIDNPTSGLYIRRIGNKTDKVLIR